MLFILKLACIGVGFVEISRIFAEYVGTRNRVDREMLSFAIDDGVAYLCYHVEKMDSGAFV